MRRLIYKEVSKSGHIKWICFQWFVLCQVYHSGPPRSPQRLLAAGGLQDHGPVGAGWSKAPQHVQCPPGWPWDTGQMDKIRADTDTGDWWLQKSCRNVQFSKHVFMIGVVEDHLSVLTTFDNSEMKSESNVIGHSTNTDWHKHVCVSNKMTLLNLEQLTYQSAFHTVSQVSHQEAIMV